MNPTLELWRLIRNATLSGIERTRDLYATAVRRTLIVSFTLIILSFACNIAGGWWASMNIVLSLLVTLVLIVIAFEPKVLALVLVSEWAGTRTRFSDEIRLGRYADLVLQFLFWESFFFFVLGTISFQEHPWKFLVIIAAITVILLSGKSTGWAKKIVYYYAVGMVIACLFSLVPNALIFKWTGGWDPAQLGTTKSEEALYNLRQTEENAADTRKAQAINDITSKIKAGIALTPQEEQLRKEFETPPKKILSATAARRPYTSEECSGDVSFISLGTQPKVVNTGAKCSITEQVIAGRAALLDWQGKKVAEDFPGKPPGGIVPGQITSAEAVGNQPTTLKVMLCLPDSPVKGWSCS